MASVVSVTVRVRDATREGLRRVQNSINGLNRGILHSLGDIFQDGIGQAIARGLNAAASNPYVASAMVTLIAALTLQLGTALGGAITLAFGAAFVAVGVMSALQSKKVQKNWEQATKSMKKDFAEVGKPLIPVVNKAIDKLEEMSKKFAPHFKRAMEESAPHLNTFIDKISSGIEKFGKEGFKPMMDGFNKLLTSMDWEGFFERLGRAFGHLGDSVSKNSDDVAAVLDSLLNLLPRAIELLADMTDAWARMKPWVTQIWELISTLLEPAVTALGIAFSILGDIMEMLQGPLELLNRVFNAVMEEAIKPLGREIGEFLAPLWDGLVEGFKEGWEILEVNLLPVMRDLWEIIKNTGRDLIEIFLPGLAEADGKSKQLGASLKEWVIDKMQALSDWLAEHRDDIQIWAQRIASGVIFAAGFIKGLIEGLMELWGWITRAWDLIVRVFGQEGVMGMIGSVSNLWSWVFRVWQIALNIVGINSVMGAITWVRDLWNWVKRDFNNSVTFRAPTIPGIIAMVRDLWNWVSRTWSRTVNFHFSVSGAIDTIRGMLGGRAHGGVVGHVGQAASGGVRNGMTLVGEHGPELVDLAPGSHVRSNPDTRRLLSNGAYNQGTPMIVFQSSGRRVDDILLEILREAIHQRGGDPVTVLGGRS